MALDLWSRVWLTPPAGRKMWAVALTHFSFLSVTWWVNSPCARASDSSLRKSSGRHGDQKKGVLASSALDHNRRTAVGAKSWAVAAKTWLWSVMISYAKKSHKTWLSRSWPAIPQLRHGLWLRLCFGFPQKTQNLPFKNPRSPRSCGISAICYEKKTSTKLWPPEHGWCLTCQHTMRKMAAKKCMPYANKVSQRLSQTNSHIFVTLQRPKFKKNSWWKSHASNCICRPSTSCQFHAICRSSNLKIIFPISEFVLQPPKRPLGLGHAAPWQNHLKARNKAMKGDSMGQHPPDIGHNRHAAQCSSWTQQGLMSPVIFVNQLALVLQSPNL